MNIEKYEAKLIEMGIAETRVPTLAAAVSNLNNELAKLDLRGIRAFTKDVGILGQLDIFARTAPALNMAQTIYYEELNRSERMIGIEDACDKAEFAEFTDSLFFKAEHAMELGIPGARLLCKSLIMLRRRAEGKIGLSFSRLATTVHTASLEFRGLEAHGLEIRLTNSFKGSVRYMDSWFSIGTVTVLRSISREEEDMDGGADLMFVQVETKCNKKGIKRALRDSFSYHGCTCEHDCCRCRSQRIGKVKCIDPAKNIWACERSWTFNC